MDKDASKQYLKMTQTPIPRLVVTLGIPTTVSMLVTNIYNMADTYFVSKLGTSASGAVGVVFGLMAIIQAIGFMFGHGAGSIISRKTGRKRSGECLAVCVDQFFLFSGSWHFIRDFRLDFCGTVDAPVREYRHDPAFREGLRDFHSPGGSADGNKLCNE